MLRLLTTIHTYEETQSAAPDVYTFLGTANNLADDFGVDLVLECTRIKP